MRAFLSICLSLMLVLQGQAFRCVTDACHQALQLVESVDSCCDTESPEVQSCCCGDVETCETDCALETHTHKSALVFESSQRSSLPALALLNVLSEANLVRFPKTSQLPAAHAQDPPNSPLLVGYCVWRL
ncbi:MAG: hypothetical protein ACN4GF_03300 [Lentimonas sp.]